MDTQTQSLNEIDALPVDPSWRVAEIDDSPELKYRLAFRPKLLEYFNKTDKFHGAYVYAEVLTMEYFFQNFGIKFEQWQYRNRRQPIQPREYWIEKGVIQ